MSLLSDISFVKEENLVVVAFEILVAPDLVSELRFELFLTKREVNNLLFSGGFILLF